MVERYADLVLKYAQVLMHDEVEVYLDENYLTMYIAQYLCEEGWPSKGGHVPYPRGRRRADMVTESPDGALKITNECKYLVVDYPGAKKGPGEWQGIGKSIVAQHLGIVPGKSINAVDDIEKLKSATGTHVSFLLVRHESRERSGDSAVAKFVEMTGVERRPWQRFDRQWEYPSDCNYQVRCHLWCRPIPEKA
jgi:hypothetical protein